MYRVLGEEREMGGKEVGSEIEDERASQRRIQAAPLCLVSALDARVFVTSIDDVTVLLLLLAIPSGTPATAVDTAALKSSIENKSFPGPVAGGGTPCCGVPGGEGGAEFIGEPAVGSSNKLPQKSS